MRIQSTSNKRESADAETDSSGSEAASESAASVIDFDAYLNFLHSTAAAEVSATASAKSDLTAFTQALVDVERLGRLKLPNAWDIISKYLLLYNQYRQSLAVYSARRYPLNVCSSTLNSYFVKAESKWAMN